jgi:hypothetical protein
MNAVLECGLGISFDALIDVRLWCRFVRSSDMKDWLGILLVGFIGIVEDCERPESVANTNLIVIVLVFHVGVFCTNKLPKGIAKLLTRLQGLRFLPYLDVVRQVSEGFEDLKLPLEVVPLFCRSDVRFLADVVNGRPLLLLQFPGLGVRSRHAPSSLQPAVNTAATGITSTRRSHGRRACVLSECDVISVMLPEGWCNTSSNECSCRVMLVQCEVEWLMM